MIASKAGADDNPAWFHNLRATPEVKVEIGTEEFQAEASVVDRQERDRLYARMVEKAPGFADYETKTTRVIPVITLNRLS
ncbi:nitroreductase/quinone reductase family protein [Nonomuraea ferruginea]